MKRKIQMFLCLFVICLLLPGCGPAGMNQTASMIKKECLSVESAAEAYAEYLSATNDHTFALLTASQERAVIKSAKTLLVYTFEKDKAELSSFYDIRQLGIENDYTVSVLPGGLFVGITAANGVFLLRLTDGQVWAFDELEADAVLRSSPGGRFMGLCGQYLNEKGQKEYGAFLIDTSDGNPTAVQVMLSKDKLVAAIPGDGGQMLVAQQPDGRSYSDYYVIDQPGGKPAKLKASYENSTPMGIDDAGAYISVLNERIYLVPVKEKGIPTTNYGLNPTGGIYMGDRRVFLTFNDADIDNQVVQAVVTDPENNGEYQIVVNYYPVTVKPEMFAFPFGVLGVTNRVTSLWTKEGGFVAPKWPGEEKLVFLPANENRGAMALCNRQMIGFIRQDDEISFYFYNHENKTVSVFSTAGE